MTPARREDVDTRDRIGTVARDLRKFVEERDADLKRWQTMEEERARRRFHITLRALAVGLVITAVLFGATVGMTAVLNGDRIADIQRSRLGSFEASCRDTNDLRRTIGNLAVHLGAPVRVVSAALPLMPDCALYALRRLDVSGNPAQRTFSAEAHYQVTHDHRPPRRLG